MIESLKLPNIDQETIKTIEHINPWWEKNLEKLVKKQQKWLVKFNFNPTDYFAKTSFNIEEYGQLFQSVNNYLNFYNQKMKLIVTNKKLFKKFEKMANDYVSLLGLTHGIYLAMKYYVDLDTQMIEDKRHYAMRLANEFINTTYQRYKREISKLFTKSQHEVLKQIYQNEKVIDLDLFNPLLIFNLIAKYATKLNQIKELDDETLLKILYLTVVSANFINNYAFASMEFISKIY